MAVVDGRILETAARSLSLATPTHSLTDRNPTGIDPNPKRTPLTNLVTWLPPTRL